MAYQCVIKDANGNVKRIVSAKEVADKAWRDEFGEEFKLHERLTHSKGMTQNAKEFKCKVCDTKFYSPYPNAVYCKEACRKKKKKPKSANLPKRNCLWCGKEFQPMRSNNYYCPYEGRKCTDAYTRERNRKRRLELAKERALDGG